MSEDLKKGSCVVLRTFHNLAFSTEDVDDSEDYWKLIGCSGIIVSDGKKIHPAFKDMGPRVAVKFDVDLKTFGLEVHNEIKNTLWIFMSDLEEKIKNNGQP